jgi:hypothetical protein
MSQGEYDSIIRKTEINAAFDSRYIEKTFLIWYKAGRLPYNRIINLLPPDDLGRRPAANKFGDWRARFGWEERADILDAEVARRIESIAINEKVEMLNRHAEAAKLMVQKAIDFIKDHDITKMDTAVRMLVQGVEIEQASRGIPTALLKIAELDNEGIMNMANKLLGQMNPDDAVKMLADAAKPEKGDTVEAEFEDADDAGK